MIISKDFDVHQIRRFEARKKKLEGGRYAPPGLNRVKERLHRAKFQLLAVKNSLSLEFSMIILCNFPLLAEFWSLTIEISLRVMAPLYTNAAPVLACDRTLHERRVGASV